MATNTNTIKKKIFQADHILLHPEKKSIFNPEKQKTNKQRFVIIKDILKVERKQKMPNDL